MDETKSPSRSSSRTTPAVGGTAYYARQYTDSLLTLHALEQKKEKLDLEFNWKKTFTMIDNTLIRVGPPICVVAMLATAKRPNVRLAAAAAAVVLGTRKKPFRFGLDDHDRIDTALRDYEEVTNGLFHELVMEVRRQGNLGKASIIKQKDLLDKKIEVCGDYRGDVSDDWRFQFLRPIDFKTIYGNVDAEFFMTGIAPPRDVFTNFPK